MDIETWAACGMPLRRRVPTNKPSVARGPVQAAVLPPAPCSREHWRTLTSGHAPWPFGAAPDPEVMVAAGQNLVTTPAAFAAAVNANRSSVMEIRERGGQQVKVDRVRAEIKLSRAKRRKELRDRMKAAKAQPEPAPTP